MIDKAPYVTTEGERLVIHWPDLRSRTFSMTSEVFEHIINERNALLDCIDAARALHTRMVTDGIPHCRECLATRDPCPTIRALDGAGPPQQ